MLVLLSGGIDSSCCVSFYRSQGFSVEALFVDYGHPAADAERRAARSISRYFGVPLREAAVRGLHVPKAGYVPGRNALLVATALASRGPSPGLLALGIHAGTPYPDCTLRFIDACQALTDVYADGTVQMAAPFLEWTKGDILEYVQEVGLPLRRTYSCEMGASKPCGRCLSCQDRARIS